MTIGQNIKRIRQEKNLTQTMLSTRMGYTSNSVLSKLENDHLVPNINHLRRLSLALKVSQASILDVDGIDEEANAEPMVQQVVEQTKSSDKKEITTNVIEEDELVTIVEEAQVEKEETPVKKEAPVKEETPVKEEKQVTSNITTKEIEKSKEIVVEEEKEVEKVGKQESTSHLKKSKTQLYPFYNNVFTILLVLILIAAPISMLFLKETKYDLYILIGSVASFVIVLCTLLLNVKKKNKVNKEVTGEIKYKSELSTGKLTVVKIIFIILSLGFIACGYFYVTKVNIHISNVYIKYALLASLGISALLKLLSTLSISTKNKTTKITSNNTTLVISLIVDLIVTIGLLIFFNIEKINILDNMIIFAVAMNMISYLLLLFNNKYSSTFKLNE